MGLEIECLSAGHPGKRSIEVVGPGVIGADKVSPAAHLPFLEYQPRAAMATDIEENPQLAVGAARYQHRGTAEIEREHHPWLGELIDVTQAERQASKQPLALGLEPLGVIVDPG